MTFGFDTAWRMFLEIGFFVSKMHVTFILFRRLNL